MHALKIKFYSELAKFLLDIVVFIKKDYFVLTLKCFVYRCHGHFVSTSKPFGVSGSIIRPPDPLRISDYVTWNTWVFFVLKFD